MSSNSTLSDDDVQLLYILGRQITQDAVGFLWETCFMSAYGVFFWIAIWTIWRKGLKSPSSIAMLFIVIYLYCTSITLWALNVTVWFQRARASLMDYPELSLSDRRDVSDSIVEAYGTPMEALFMFNMVVGDSVVIWRAWVLYTARDRWMLSLPIILLTCSLIFSIIDVTCLTGAGWSNQSGLADGGGVCDNAELIAWAFSFVTNATCTLLIGVKAWQHRRSTRALAMTHNSSRMSTNRILSLLVESGFVYCLFWLTQYILFVDISRGSPAIYAYELFAALGDQISGMYPTLIIVIVNLHQTIWDQNSSTVKGGSFHFTTSGGRSAGNTSGAYGSQRGAKIQLDGEISTTEAIGMDKITRAFTSTEEV
ncbi:hypothetical protein B0H16DRAFT_1459627 [Mycena metata]|uniref:Uncharacterized protein n=1 Tax=Mycena metata TaxID=1033252 RepID=A0AAD7NAS9_9AGAR|nr:hypothetical protein B0H16DRAFT_1459627 [Mycena metata]